MPDIANSCAHLAAEIRAQNVDGIRLLVNAGADVNCRLRDFPVLWFSETKSMLKELIELGGDIDVRHGTDNRTLLHFNASQFGEMVEPLLQLGADVNARNDKLETPLIMAALVRNIESVRLLLDYGADVNAQSIDGSTALHYAVDGGGLIATLLIENGANLELLDNAGNTALFIAAMYPDNYDLVDLILRKGGNPNASKRSDGYMPLHIAARKGHLNVIKALCKNGCDVNSATADGSNAYDISLAHGHLEAARLIETWGVRSAKCR